MENTSTRVGLARYGYWRSNLLRNLYEIDGVHVKRCVDLCPERRAAVRKWYSTVQASAEADDIPEIGFFDRTPITFVSFYSRLAHPFLLPATVFRSLMDCEFSECAQVGGDILLCLH